MVRGDVALVTGDPDTAFREAMLANDILQQNPEVPLGLAMRAAIWSRNLDRARQVAELRAAVPTTGPWGQAELAHVNAAVAALEGRTAEAIEGFRASRSSLERMEQMFDAAARVVDAAVLLPGEPDVRAWATEVRPLLE